MNSTVRRRRQWTALVFLLLGILLVQLDFRVRTNVAYPEYVDQYYYGPDTQRMIVEDVIGTNLTLDAISDLVGFICLTIALIVIATYAKPKLDLSSLTRYERRMLRLLPRVSPLSIAIPAVSAILYSASKLIPFWDNGLVRYASGYFINFGLCILTAAATFFGAMCFFRESDRYQSHRDIMVVYIFMIVTVLSGLLRDFAAFYGLKGVKTAYTVINAVFVVIMCVLLAKYVFIESKIDKQNGEQNPEQNAETEK